jgi:hypothetical protein
MCLPFPFCFSSRLSSHLVAARVRVQSDETAYLLAVLLAVVGEDALRAWATTWPSGRVTCQWDGTTPLPAHGAGAVPELGPRRQAEAMELADESAETHGMGECPVATLAY